MQFQKYNVRESLRYYVNCIMSDESNDVLASMELPLYAEGYPGIMYQKSENDMFFRPKNIKLSELFLYGQSLNPSTLTTHGPFQYVVLQLYPFASKYLLNIDPKILNDNCYNLLQLKNIEIDKFHKKLLATNDLSIQIETMCDIIETLLSIHNIKSDDKIQYAIHQIIKNKGIVKISDIRDKVYLTERTFERNFMNEVGITPKQFAKIIQFQNSLEKIDNSQTERFTDIAYDSGFADQSHFIRVFKSYTGLSPKQYRLQAIPD